MPKVDCWRLLGVSPEASAEEVRAGFAKRVRDVHPDSGGTGDALTMRLLVEARDEALELSGRRENGGTRPGPSRRGGPRPARGAPRWSWRERGDNARPGGGEPRRCHVCGQVFPRDQLGYGRLNKGFWVRAGRERVLMCSFCASIGWERREKTARLKAALLLVGVGALVLFLLFTLA